MAAGPVCDGLENGKRESAGINHTFSPSYFKNPFIPSNSGPFNSKTGPSSDQQYNMPDRPVIGRACTTCFGYTDRMTEDSRAKLEKPRKPRIVDVLNLPAAATKTSFGIIKRISDIFYCMTLKTPHKYPRVDSSVLNSERVKEGIAKNVGEISDDEGDTVHDPSLRRHQQQKSEIRTAKERVKARSTLRRMRAHISVLVQRFASFLLFKLLRLILRTVQICPAQMDRLKQVAEDGVPIVYLPNHRSHLDYVLLSFTLGLFGLRIPYVAAGDNLDIPGFSWLLRSLGAFFIKRRSDKDHVYRAMLQSYVEELLKHGESLEFFIEAGRSRTNRLILPKAGLLSIVVDTYLKGAIQNAYIVPVSISYEKVIEGSFSSELMGESKKKETSWGAIKAIWKVFTTKYGSVRIDFAQPVTIKDYLASLRSTLPTISISNTASAAGSEFDFCPQQQEKRPRTLPSRNSLLSLCSGIDLNQMPDENRRLIKALCSHIAYDFTQNAALMSTQMLAFLLTTKYRSGGRLDDIVDDFHWLCCRLLTSSGRDVGFSGNPRNIVRYAMELLGSELVTMEISDVDSGVVSDSGSSGNGLAWEKDAPDSHMWIVRPTGTLARQHDLAYYAAPVAMVFLRETLIANALISTSIEASKSGYKNSAKTDITVHSSKIIDRALAMADLLKNEFLFDKPCVSLRQSLEKTMEKMIEEGLLTKRSSPSGSSSSYSPYLRFCLERSQMWNYSPQSSPASRRSSVSPNLERYPVWSPTSPSSPCSRRSSVSTGFGYTDGDATGTTGRKGRRTGVDGTFYVASEEEEMADYEDEGDPFVRPSTDRRGSYGVVSMMDSEDDCNTDIVRFYASILAPMLDTYKLALKTVMTDLSTPAERMAFTRTQWKTEKELVVVLLNEAKRLAQENSCIYGEFVNIESMRNAIRWLISKGVIVSDHDRLHLHESYMDDRETLERLYTEIDELCVVVI